MTEKAIQILSKNPRGYFLFVEDEFQNGRVQTVKNDGLVPFSSDCCGGESAGGKQQQNRSLCVLFCSLFVSKHQNVTVMCAKWALGFKAFWEIEQKTQTSGKKYI
jgi:hypothetical protein